MTQNLHPHVVLMDIVMPGMDGMEATREIMHHIPTPIVMVSAGLAGRESEVAFQALQLGALTVLPKPTGPLDPNYEALAHKLVSTVRSMADVRVIHHWRRDTNGQTDAQQPRSLSLMRSSVQPQIVAIAASTGGPAALNTILSNLPADFSLPIVIVQHLAADFLPSLVGWLDTVTPLRVEIAQPNQYPEPGHVYFAPGDVHLVLTRRRNFATQPTPVTTHIPSGDVLLESVAAHYKAEAIGMVLTGMGNDGAFGLRQMHAAGAMTIAQNQETCAVFGMPQEAIALRAVRHVLALTDIPGALVRLSTSKETLS
jgi:two-component system chemotaxis response regulator CheB